MSTYEGSDWRRVVIEAAPGLLSGVPADVTELGSESIAPESTNVSVSVPQSRRTALPRSGTYHHELPACQLLGGQKALQLDFVR